MPIQVADAGDRYEISLDNELAGFADVVYRDDEAVLPHVEVFPQFEGRGLGSFLVRDTLKDLKARGKTIRAVCPFVVAYIRKHPDEG